MTVNALYNKVDTEYRQALRRIHALNDAMPQKHTLSDALYRALNDSANVAAQLERIAVVASDLDDAEWYENEINGGAVRS